MRSLSCLKIFNEERNYLMKNLNSDCIPIFYIIGNAFFLKYKGKPCGFFWLLNIYKRSNSKDVGKYIYKKHRFTSARELFEEEILNERKDLKSIK